MAMIKRFAAAGLTGCLLLVLSSQALSSPYSTPDGIWVMNRDGGDPAKVTDVRGPFDVSPVDDRLVVAGGDYGNTRDLYVVPLDGSQPTNLTNSTEYELSPRWSPNGEQIAFVRYLESPYTNSSPDEDATLWVMNADGSDEAQIAHITDSDINEASWSPDGDRIAFSATGDEDEIYVVDPDGQDLRLLVESESNGSLSWSSDSSEVSYVTDDWSLWAVATETGDERVILPGGENSGIRFAVWSPLGDSILFARREGLFTVKPDGTSEMTLTNDYAYGADWSPDGRSITFFSSHISVIDLETGAVTSLTREGRDYEPYEEIPAWTSDGSRILFFRSVWQGVPQTFTTRRTLTSRIVDGAIVKGRLMSERKVCHSLAPLHLQWKPDRDQEWKTLVKYRTERNGTFSWPLPKSDGFYRLQAPRLERQVGFDTAICLRAIGKRLQQ